MERESEKRRTGLSEVLADGDGCTAEDHVEGSLR